MSSKDAVRQGISFAIVVLLFVGAIWLARAAMFGSGGGQEDKDSGQEPTFVQPGDASGQAQVSLPNLQTDVEMLTRRTHRLAGSEQGHEAAGYIAERLQEILEVDRIDGGGAEAAPAGGPGPGGDRVIVQRFGLIRGDYSDATIRVADGEPEAIYPCRPNLLAGSITPVEGLRGQTLYVGPGRLEDYREVDPGGRIVVMDYDEGYRNWLTAFGLGARAVVFVGTGEPAAFAYHHLNIPAMLPRFYLPREQAEAMGLLAPAGPEVVIRSRIDWNPREGRNVIAFIEGRSPQFRFGRDEAIILAAPIDSFGEVPDLSYGARNAGNASVLLGIAELLKVNRPYRDVILCFFDGRAQYNAGANAFYTAFHVQANRSDIPGWLNEIEAKLVEEREYIRPLLDAMALDDPLAAEGDVLDDVVDELSKAVRALDEQHRAGVQDLRTVRLQLTERIDPLQEEIAQTAAPAEGQRLGELLESIQAQIEDLDQRITEQEQVSQDWSELIRAINQEQPVPEAVRAKGLYDQVIEFVRDVKFTRGEEIEASLAHNADAQILAALLKDKMIVLHMTVDLNWTDDRWTVVHGDSVRRGEETGDTGGTYQNGVFPVFRTAIERMEARSEEPVLPGFNRWAISGTFSSTSVFCPAVRADGGAVARLYGVYNLAAVTLYDRRVHDGHPTDTPDRLLAGLESLRSQGAEVGQLAWALANESGLSQEGMKNAARFAWSQWNRGGNTGPNAKLMTAASTTADQPARGAIIALLPKAGQYIWTYGTVLNTPPGFETLRMVRSDGNGLFRFGPMLQTFYATNNYVGMLFDDRGVPTHVVNTETVFCELNSISIRLFEAKGLATVGLGMDRGAERTQVVRPKSTAPFRPDQSLIAEIENVVCTFIRPRAVGLKIFNTRGLAILNNTVEDEAGQGVAFETPFETIQTTRQSAWSRWNLDEARLAMLRSNQILQGSLETLSRKAKAWLDEAEDPAVEMTPAERHAQYMAADAVNRRVYTPLVDFLNDLVTAVVFLLLLSIPFAYALERLLIGTPQIYRQIGWVTVFFLATFAVLYFVNPAFRIAATPVIIFLAFAIIVLSIVVIAIMTRKLKEEVKRMQGLGTTVHSSDVSRLSTMMAAVQMGISTMRRRPLRTLLTAVTVVLLTFTILTFASFSNTWGVRRTYITSLRGPERIMARPALWSAINESIVEMMAGHMEDRAEVVPRLWLAPSAQEAVDIRNNLRPPIEFALDMPGGQSEDRPPLVLSGTVGIDARDLERLDNLAALFDGARSIPDDGIYLSGAAASTLGAEVGDELIVGGLRLRLLGVVSPQALTEYSELETSSLLPVDFSASIEGTTAFSAEDADRANESADMESTQFVTYTPDEVAFVSPATCRRMGGMIRSFQIYPDRPELLDELAEEAALLAPMPAYVGDSDGVHRLLFTTLTEAKGFRVVIVPVVLGGLIVFATMLGSVSDREREIYTFSALGLAPPHVSSLFFAEASVYAVIGGMGGYLLGQSVGRITGWLQSMGMIEAPAMNYSSSNAIVTVIIVMGTVLVSTIYPAIKASGSANPGVQRMWRIPKPKGDLFDLLFPFTVSSYDITGVVSFLKEHFDNYGDTSLGSFATEVTHVFRQEGDKDDLLGFEANVALAPFDLGVTQSFAMLSRPSGIEGIDEVRVLIQRRSGSPGDWRRANKIFIAELRKQLLIWRALPTEVVERYRAQTLDQWDTLQVGLQLLDAEESA